MKTILFCLLVVAGASDSVSGRLMAAETQSEKAEKPAEAVSSPASDQNPPSVLRSKYGALLKKIEVPQDLQGYGEVRVYGWWGGSTYMGYQDLPPGYWVYLYPDWYIFEGPPGMPCPYLSKAERAVFSECQDKEKVPDSLIKAWAAFAKAAKQGDAKSLREMCLPFAVEVSESELATTSRGFSLSVSALQKRFDTKVLLARPETNSCLLVRTAPMAFWFVETAGGGWKLYRVLDKELE
jgi:hypothetical protein